MNALSIVLLGAVVTAFTQAIKRVFPKVNGIYVVAFIALFAGLFQSFVMPLIPHGVIQKTVQGFAAAVTFYEIILRNTKND